MSIVLDMQELVYKAGNRYILNFPNCLFLQNGKIYASGQTKQMFTSEKLSRFLNYPVNVVWENNRINVTLEVNANMKQLMQLYRENKPTYFLIILIPENGVGVFVL